MTARVIPMRVDIAVVGRGLVGMAAALAFARAGRSVALIGPEAPPPQYLPGRDPRVYALSAQTRALLEPLGIWGAIAPDRIASVTDMRVYPESGGQSRGLHFSAFETGVEALAWITENGALAQSLRQALQFSPVRPVEGRLAGVSCGPRDAFARLQLEDGRAFEARLVVGADGMRSATRELARIPSEWRDYPQHALVANFDCERPHRHIAWQWFGEYGILALLPLPPGPDAPGRYSMVWSAPVVLAEHLRQLEADALCRQVEAASASVAGSMTLISEVAVHPLQMGRVSTLIGPRLALIGDAAHGVHPLAGQGMNLGFGDLADLVSATSAGDDPGARAALRRYERSRAEPVLAMQTLTDTLQKLFDPNGLAPLQPLDRPVALLRDLGWDLIARSGWVKRALITHAMGLDRA